MSPTSFTSQSRPLVENKTPGPNSYRLRGLVGYARHDYSSSYPVNPAWSIGSRHTSQPKDASPGPGAYALKQKDKSPAVSIKSRHIEERRSDTPGPGAYSPHISGPSAKKGIPSYSFGSRLGDSIKDETPGPGAYSSHILGPSASKSVPAWSLGARPADHYDDQPGPADYSRSYLPSDQVTMRGRFYDNGANFMGTGPGMYQYNDKGNSLSKRQPAWSLGARLEKKGDDTGPGPGSYNVTDTGHRSPGFSIAGKRRSGDENDSPGPGRYGTLNSYQQSSERYKGVSIKGHRRTNEDNVSPGPAAYSPSVPGTFKTTPAVSIFPRRKKTTKSSQPSDDAYVPSIMSKGRPENSLKGHHVDKIHDSSTGPNNHTTTARYKYRSVHGNHTTTARYQDRPGHDNNTTAARHQDRTRTSQNQHQHIDREQARTKQGRPNYYEQSPEHHIHHSVIVHDTPPNYTKSSRQPNQRETIGPGSTYYSTDDVDTYHERVYTTPRGQAQNGQTTRYYTSEPSSWKKTRSDHTITDRPTYHYYDDDYGPGSYVVEKTYTGPAYTVVSR